MKQASVRLAASVGYSKAFKRDAVALRIVRREFGKSKSVEMLYTSAATMENPVALLRLLSVQRIPIDATVDVDTTSDYYQQLTTAVGNLKP